MSDRKNGKNTVGRNPNGTFASGNSGKPVGSQNKTTMAVFSLLDGEAEQITRKAIELALEGDRAALRLCLERIAPPRRDIPISLPLGEISTAKDAVNASAAVISETALGNIGITEASRLMAMLTNFTQTLEIFEFEQRLETLEAKNEEVD